MSRPLITFMLFLLFSTTALADSAETQADHDALRKLKADAVTSVNSRDYAAMQKLLHQPFMATVLTQNDFSDFSKLKVYFESLYTRDLLRVKNISINAEADDLSQIYQGTFAVNKGSTKEHYEMADGRKFDLDGRWTAVSIKDNGEWKLLAIHTGTNFLDNPVLNAIEKSVMWFGVVGAICGLAIGFFAGWFFRRARSEKSAV